jgi:hypothetical protein
MYIHTHIHTHVYHNVYIHTHTHSFINPHDLPPLADNTPGASSSWMAVCGGGVCGRYRAG